jgi:primosomal protein N' (replication factor Y)
VAHRTSADGGADGDAGGLGLDLGLDDGPAGEPAGPSGPDGAGSGHPRLVALAIDAPGPAGARAWTYHVPPELDDLEPGEAVLAEYAHRQTLAVVLGEGEPAPEGVRTRPVRARVRADGPLIPALTVRLAGWIARHYLAPPALTIRAMLPPGLLERLELVAELAPAWDGSDDPGTAVATPSDPRLSELLMVLADGARRVRDLPALDGRPALMRRLRSLEAGGRISLEWTLSGATAGPRYERWLVATDAGRVAASSLRRDQRPDGRPLGPRQRAALLELASAPAEGLPAPALSGRHGSGALAGLVRRELVRVEVRERARRPLGARHRRARGTRPVGAALTTPQAEAVTIVRTAIEARDPRPLLLDGVTGGGKTAIYVEAIAASLEAGRPALVLVPEIALALPLVDRLRADLEAEVAVLHSALGEGERADEWRRIRAGDADVVVGTRLAVLAPLADVGLVIVDEEHEAAYKSDRTPRLQARDTALRLAELAGAATILGSATPAVDTVGRARAGTYRSVRLPTRPTGVPPVVELVDLRAELAAGNRGLLSARLAEQLSVLDVRAGDRAILVINRRGSASVVLCRDCGHVQACPECARPLVFHQAGYTLRCHGCGTAAPLATRCPACRSARIRYLGGGTERVEREVRERFPGLRVGRLDRDIVERRGGAERVIDAFTEGRLDVLVGTSLVAKGLDIPEVVLVGVVSADVALNLPDERAAERTYQLLRQAVGRAGRGDAPGLAIIQTYQPGHPAIQAVVNADAGRFYDAELAMRERFGSPPYGRLVKLTIGLPDRAEAEARAAAEAERLRALALERDAGVSVVGPAPAFIARRADRWRYNVVLRGPDPAALLGASVEAPWSVDVDPESLL